MFENPTIINNFGNALKKKEFTCYEFWGIIPHKNFFGEIPGKRAGGTLKIILGEH